MLSVLHLMSGPGDLQTRRSSQLLSRGLGDEFPATFRSIGRGLDYRNAAHAAVSLRAGWGPEAELIHAWDLPAFVAALCSAIPTVFSPGVPLTTRAARWFRLAAPRHGVHLLAQTESQRALWVRWGAEPRRCHVSSPGMYPEDSRPLRDEALRQRLGITPDEYVVLAPGESIRAAEHERAVWAISILHVLDQRYRLLLWGRGGELHVATDLARRLGQERLLITAEKQLGRRVEFEELIAACDAGLVAARGDVPMLPILTCMAAGLPLVAAESRVAADLLRSEQTAILVKGGAPRELGRAVLRLREQPGIARAMAGAASIDAAVRFSPARYVEAIRRVYWAAGMTGGGPPVANRATMEAVGEVVR